MSQALRILVDLGLASFLLYRVILLIRGTKSMQVAVGLVVLLMITYFVRTLDLTVTSWLLEQFWLAGMLLLVVVFQPEIRQALADLGKSPLMAKVFFSENLRFLDEIAATLRDFSGRKIGALIVLEQDTGLKNIEETGVPVHGEVTQELLSVIFQPPSALHDGAVLISLSGKLAAAKCLLPLTADSAIDKSYGVRHRAAVSLAEASDAIVLVVSEQTGKIAMARNGRLDPEIDVTSTIRDLKELYRAKVRKGLLRHPLSDAAGARRSA